MGDIKRLEALECIIKNRLDDYLDRFLIPKKTILITEDNQKAIEAITMATGLEAGKEYVITFNDGACSRPYKLYELKDVVDEIVEEIIKNEVIMKELKKRTGIGE